MNLNTGQIYRLKEGDPVPPDSVAIPNRLADIYEGSNRKERRKLLAQQRRRHRQQAKAAHRSAVDSVIQSLEAESVEV